MKQWMETVTRMLTWKGSLPSSWGLEHVSIHLSTLIAVPAAGLALGGLLSNSLTPGDWQAAAITLPIVWMVSLAVRVAAQLLAVGSQANHFEMVVSPVGNVSSDYEHLSGPSILLYAVAGQSASLMLGLFGLLILSGLSPSANGLTLATVLELQTGWSPSAWASQTVWVNGFLFFLHLLPAGPFDTRAFVVGWCHISRPTLADGAIHRLLASTDSHLATAIAGFSLAMISMRLATMESVAIWVVLLIVSAYLFAVSQFESYQAQMEEDASLMPRRPWKRRDTASTLRQSSAPGEYGSMFGYGETLDAPSAHEVLDIDEILRKLHREGQDALSPFEKEALLSASRELQARRQPRQ